MMKKYFWISVLFLFISVAALSTVGFAMGGSAPSEKPSVKKEAVEEPKEEIGDLDHLINALKEHRPAKARTTSTVNMLGMIQTTTTFLETKDIQKDKCTIYIKTEKNDLKFSDELKERMLKSGTTQEEIDKKQKEALASAKEREGIDGTATFKIDDLMAMLNRWKEGKFSTKDWDAAEDKSGPMFD